MNSVRSNDISLKYQKCTTLGSKDIEIINSEFVAKTQFLYNFHLQSILTEFILILALSITFQLPRALFTILPPEYIYIIKLFDHIFICQL